MSSSNSPVSERLAATDGEIASWTLHDRMGRVSDLMTESWEIFDWAVETMIWNENRKLAASVILFSGGNDSTVLTHLFKDTADYAAHANTTIGIEATRQFVRDTCAAWGMPLIERTPPNPKDHYKALVLDQGFPGPGHHFKMFQRLKERALRQVRNELVTNPRKERVAFIAGRRRAESDRRADVPELERVGSIVWVSPLVNWTKPDLATYRQMYDVPRNEVADLIHMSGECLCGSFAHDGERDEIEAWFGTDEALQLIAWLEEQIKDRDDIPEHRKKWGWGGNAALLKASRKQTKKAGYLCGGCESNLEQLRIELEGAA